MNHFRIFLWINRLNLYRSWEAIFRKSSFAVTENELKCCYRIVELCKDCVLIVYQYAFEQKPGTIENDIAKNTKVQSHFQTTSLGKFKNISSSLGNLNYKNRSK